MECENKNCDKEGKYYIDTIHSTLCADCHDIIIPPKTLNKRSRSRK